MAWSRGILPTKYKATTFDFLELHVSGSCFRLIAKHQNRHPRMPSESSYRHDMTPRRFDGECHVSYMTFYLSEVQKAILYQRFVNCCGSQLWPLTWFHCERLEADSHPRMPSESSYRHDMTPRRFDGECHVSYMTFYLSEVQKAILYQRFVNCCGSQLWPLTWFHCERLEADSHPRMPSESSYRHDMTPRRFDGERHVSYMTFYLSEAQKAILYQRFVNSCGSHSCGHSLGSIASA